MNWTLILTPAVSLVVGLIGVFSALAVANRNHSNQVKRERADQLRSAYAELWGNVYGMALSYSSGDAARNADEWMRSAITKTEEAWRSYCKVSVLDENSSRTGKADALVTSVTRAALAAQRARGQGQQVSLSKAIEDAIEPFTPWLRELPLQFNTAEE